MELVLAAGKSGWQFLSTAPREDYGEAAALFLKVGNTYLEKRLTASSAKKHFMKAGLCMLADKDAVGAKARLEKFKDSDYTFERSREGKFLEVRAVLCP